MIDNTQQALMKHFASVLRKRATAETPYMPSISSELTRFLSRKELIAIIHEKHDGKIPKELDLLSIENEELVTHIADDLYVISYITRQWSEQLKTNTSATKVKENTTNTPVKPTTSKTKKDEK